MNDQEYTSTIQELEYHASHADEMARLNGLYEDCCLCYVNEENRTEFENEVYEYLDNLRESGVTNMFGAGVYIQTEFGVDEREASC